MFYCPYCGIKVKDNEHYCLNCGEQLPDDIDKRFKPRKKFNQRWFMPLSLFIFLILLLPPFYFLLQHQNTQAKFYFEQGEASILAQDYSTALDHFEKALSYKNNFYDADISLTFANYAIEIDSLLTEALQHLEELNFAEALSSVNEAEDKLKNFHGPAVSDLINHILSIRNDIHISQINYYLDHDPSIDILKNLLWEAESIQNEEAERLTELIRNQIIDYTFSKASEKLNNKQFNDAQLLVEDGLKYAANSEKLLSLQTAIGKEKTAFEITEQQRIEQAIDMAEEERELNEQDAVQLEQIELDQNEQGRIVVQGEVKSVATIPIHSISISYTISDPYTEIVENTVFIYPEKLYPDETGKFEFTHYDIEEDLEKIDVKVNTIKWYTD